MKLRLNLIFATLDHRAPVVSRVRELVGGTLGRTGYDAANARSKASSSSSTVAESL
jgi:hypothetical protein